MSSENTSTRNKIFGKIRHKESGLPISDLIVVAFDLDPHAFNPDIDQIFVNPDPNSRLNDPSTYKKPPGEKFFNGIPGDRLGSTITNSEGEFTITYNDEAFKIRKNKRQNNNSGDIRPDLFLTIHAAEVNGLREFDNLIFRSSWARINAGRNEEYIINIDSNTLKSHNILIPEAEQETEIILKKERENLHSHIKKTEGTNQLIEKKIREELSTLDSDTINHLHDISKLESKQDQIIKKGLNTIKQSPNPKNFVFLSDSQKTMLQPHLSADGSTYEDVPHEKFMTLLSNNSDVPSTPLDLIKNDSIAEFCRKKTKAEKCSTEALGLSSEEEDNKETNEDEEDETSGANKIITHSIENLLLSQSSPEQALQFGQSHSSARPGQDDIQQSINNFSLSASPSDVPAYYDFNQLIIAFDSLWYELIDQEIIDLSKKAYHEINKIAGESFANKFKTVAAPITEVFFDQSISINLSGDNQIPVDIVKHFDITETQYKNLSKPLKIELLNIARRLSDPYKEVYKRSSFLTPPIPHRVMLSPKEIKYLTDQGERIIRSVSGDEYTNLHTILQQLNDRLLHKYKFTIYAADQKKRSVNFGAMLTYRQKWTPLNYQVGELVKTIPLAPKEERKFNKKITITKKRNEKEIENNSSLFRDEINTTSRIESEAIKKAMNKTDFSMASEGGYSFFGLGKGSQNNNFTVNAENSSQETKKNFREAVIKSLNEIKSERKIEISTEETFNSEITESGTISNPNDEIPVTYLFYELQRRYKVSEELHRVRPVIFVAQEVPGNKDIDEDWLLTYDWILKRVILDKSYLPALNYLSTNIVGDEYSLRELKKNIDLQRSVVEELKLELQQLTSESEKRYDEFETYVNQKIGTIEEEDTDGWLSDVGDFFGGGGQSPEAAKLREEAAKEAYERSLEKAKEAKILLTREVSNLNALTEKYSKQLSEHLNRKTQVSRLKVHIKENILYYMQAIWSYEPPDQRYFRLHRTKVPHFVAPQKFYDIQVAPTENIFVDPLLNKTAHAYEFDADISLAASTEYKKLEEVADLDNLLGFKGNYMIFPLKEGNVITDYMLAPYISEGFRLRDPDEYGRMNLHDFSKYVCCLKAQTDDQEFKDKYKPLLKKYYEFLLTSPLRDGEDLIVPTGDLFIEALPGKHTLLEDFKLMHRAIDVKKVQAEVRQIEMENIRYAARLLEGEREDPDIEKKIVIEGHDGDVNVNE